MVGTGMNHVSRFIGLCSAVLTLASFSRAQQQDLPNIILILADDMGYDSVTAFNGEMGGLKTPHIDKLVGQGLHFTDAHSASAVCTPTPHCPEIRLQQNRLITSVLRGLNWSQIPIVHPVFGRFVYAGRKAIREKGWSKTSTRVVSLRRTSGSRRRAQEWGGRSSAKFVTLSYLLAESVGGESSGQVGVILTLIGA